MPKKKAVQEVPPTPIPSVADRKEVWNTAMATFSQPTGKISNPSTVWKGTLTFGMIPIPIKLHTAGRSDESIKFNQLHGVVLSGSTTPCKGRLKQQDMKCSTCNNVVPKEQIVKGYEYGPDNYVVITADELKNLEEKTSKEIEILEFAKATEIEPLYFESSFYVDPETSLAARPYHLLRRAMLDAGVVAIAQMSKNSRQHLVAIRPYGRGLMLHTLFYQNEIKAMTFLQTQNMPTEQELDIAKQLIETMEAPFEPGKYSDGYRQRVQDLINARIAGAPEPEIVVKPAGPAPVDFMAAMAASIQMAKTKKANRRIRREDLPE